VQLSKPRAEPTDGNADLDPAREATLGLDDHQLRTRGHPCSLFVLDEHASFATQLEGIARRTDDAIFTAMCGRVRLSSDVSEIKLVFSIPPHRPTPNFPPMWNAAPTDPLPVVRYDPRAEERSLDLLRWGLIPYWAKDIKIGYSTFNAKAEGIETRPAFREPFERRRCLVPVDNFYEWKKTAAGKQPYAVGLADRGVMALAGLWDR
jgi:SOS response associated peptidase (SRAP)